MFDLVINDGLVVDGSGNPWWRADIGISDGKVAEIGRLNHTKTKQHISARNKVVCPGFIDMHTHSDLMLLRYPEAEVKIRQGVTLEVLGVDGLSVMPIKPEDRPVWRRRLRGLLGDPEIEWTWRTVNDYLTVLEQARPALNVVSMVGHGTIRIMAMGFDNRSPTNEEMNRMKCLVAESMEEGAFGLSSALNVAPGQYADEEELAALASVSAQYGGFYMTHIRSESDGLLESFEEAVRIGSTGSSPVHISHHKAAGSRNWRKVVKTLERIDRLRENGFDITCDQYPYLSGAFALDTLLPPWIHDGGLERCLRRLQDMQVRKQLIEEMNKINTQRENMTQWSNWDHSFVTWVRSDKNQSHVGKSLQQIADTRGVDPYTAMFDLLVEEDLGVSAVVFFGLEDDLRLVLQHPATMIGSDGIFASNPHPRLYGTFPRILGHYVREEKVLRLEDAVRKMTSLPAQRLGLLNRGLIREGGWADLTIFDPQNVLERSTYEDPICYPEGIETVIVNGVIALKDGVLTGLRAGQVLRKHNFGKC